MLHPSNYQPSKCTPLQETPATTPRSCAGLAQGTGRHTFCGTLSPRCVAVLLLFLVVLASKSGITNLLQFCLFVFMYIFILFLKNLFILVSELTAHPEA